MERAKQLTKPRGVTQCRAAGEPAAQVRGDREQTISPAAVSAVTVPQWGLCSLHGSCAHRDMSWLSRGTQPPPAATPSTRCHQSSGAALILSQQLMQQGARTAANAFLHS